MTITAHHGDCMDVLPTIASDSIDACVTDPPAGISFMGSKWDGDKGGRRQWVAWLTQVMEEVYRVLKPGAHAVVWALPRTSHWTGTALEDAGFEIRDVVTHIFGQGYPKGKNISAAIDKEACATREIIGRWHMPGRGKRSEQQKYGLTNDEGDITAPATDAAKQWHGWNVALKPAAEFWWLVRKPISEKTIAQNVLKWSTGGLNVDACRVASSAEDMATMDAKASKHPTGKTAANVPFAPGVCQPSNSLGRWPANVVLSYPEDSYILRGDATVEQKKELYKWLHENA